MRSGSVARRDLPARALQGGAYWPVDRWPAHLFALAQEILWMTEQRRWARTYSVDIASRPQAGNAAQRVAGGAAADAAPEAPEI